MSSTVITVNTLLVGSAFLLPGVIDGGAAPAPGLAPPLLAVALMTVANYHGQAIDPWSRSGEGRS